MVVSSDPQHQHIHSNNQATYTELNIITRLVRRMLPSEAFDYSQHMKLFTNHCSLSWIGLGFFRLQRVSDRRFVSVFTTRVDNIIVLRFLLKVIKNVDRKYSKYYRFVRVMKTYYPPTSYSSTNRYPNQLKREKN